MKTSIANIKQSILVCLLYTRINNSVLPIDLVLKLFDHTQFLHNGSEIVSLEHTDIIGKVHNDFLRQTTERVVLFPKSFIYPCIKCSF